MQSYLSNFKSGLVFLMLLLVVGSCSYEDPTLKGIQSFKISKLTSKGFEMQMTAKIHNPNNYKLKVKDVHLDVTIGGVVVGEVSEVNKIVLQKKTNSELNLKFWVNFKQGGSALITSLAMKGIGKGGKVKLSGHIKASNGWVKTKIPVEIDESFSLGSLLNK